MDKDEENNKLRLISMFLNKEIKGFQRLPQLDYGNKMALEEAIRIENIIHEIINKGDK